RVEVDVDARARRASVPSFLVQPLVENALKHGADPQTGRTRVRVTARVEGEDLNLQVRDDGPGLPSDSSVLSRGIGLSNLRRRLETLYPGRYELSIRNALEGGCEVLVRIPFTPDDLAAPEDSTTFSRRRSRASAGD